MPGAVATMSSLASYSRLCARPDCRALPARSSNARAAGCSLKAGAPTPGRRPRASWRKSQVRVRSADSSSGASQVQVAVEDDAEAEQDLKDVQDIIETMELLKKRRQMTAQETRLVLMIEDPREAEKRRQLGIESPSGCSREELATAFMEVMDDRVPADRLALRTLAQEFRDWPRLREEEDSDQPGQKGRSLYAQITDVGISGGRRPSPPPTADWDSAADAAIAAAAAEKDQQKDIGETLPPWVGYSVLYGFSSIPIIIGVVVVVILFLNSLQ